MRTLARRGLVVGAVVSAAALLSACGGGGSGATELSAVGLTECRVPGDDAAFADADELDHTTFPTNPAENF